MNHIIPHCRTGVSTILSGWSQNALDRLDKVLENQINEQMISEIVQGVNDKEEYNQMLNELVLADEKYKMLRRSATVVEFFAMKKTRMVLYKEVNIARNKLSKKYPGLFHV